MQGRWLRLVPALTGVVVLAGALWLIAPLVLRRVALDGDWRLDAGTLDGTPIPVLADHPPRLTIAGGRLSGNAACNDYGGYLDVSGSSAHIHDVFQGVGRCLDDAQMASETACMAALQRVTRVEWEGERLILSGASVKMRFKPIPPPRCWGSGSSRADRGAEVHRISAAAASTNGLCPVPSNVPLWSGDVGPGPGTADSA